MRVSKRVIDTINASISDIPLETGGILGSRNKEIIDEVIMDIKNPYASMKCSYTPNVIFLNQKISLWQNESVTFKGVFHTHYFGVRTLSCGDRKYITEIMEGLPECIDYLYFPIFVLPDRALVCYKAIRADKDILIQEEPLIIEG